MTDHTDNHGNSGAAAVAAPVDGGKGGEDIFAVIREAMAHFAKGFKSQLGKQAKRVDDHDAELKRLGEEVKKLGERPLLPTGAAATLIADIDKILDDEDSSGTH